MTNQSDRRFEAACAAMSGLIPAFDFSDDCSTNDSYWNDSDLVADMALKYADALLARLAVIDAPIVQEPNKAREFYLSESTSILAGGVATHLTWHVVENPTPHFLETYKYIKVREVLE